MSPYVPLRVTAHLEAGVAHAAPWGVSLDGLLASVIHYRAKAELLAAGGVHEPLSGRDDVEDLELPLARCEGEDWHWAATCAWPAERDEEPDVRYWLSSADQRDLEQLTRDLSVVIDVKSGRYRQHHMPLLATVTSSVSWDAVGDPAAVEDLVGEQWAIGKKRAAGNGRVLRWQVEQTDRDVWAASHLHPDGAVGRPCPASCLPAHVLEEGRNGGMGPAGIRPPYHHRARERWLVLPQLLVLDPDDPDDAGD